MPHGSPPVAMLHSRESGRHRAWVTIAVAALALIGKAGGFARELLLARYFGATSEVDALLLAMTPATVVVLIVGESIRYSVITDLSATEAASGLRGFWASARHLTTTVALVGVVLSLALGFGARFFTGALAMAAPRETRDLAATLALILAPVPLAALCGNVLSAIHNARGHVLRASAAELAYNALSVPVLLAFATVGGIATAAWGYAAGHIVYALILAAPFLGRRLPSYRGPAQTHAWFRSTFPIVVAAAMLPITNVVDRVVASGLVEGSIASLNYASKMVFLPLGIVVGALGTVSFPELARRFARGSHDAAAARLRGDITIYASIMVPTAMILAVLALPVTAVLLERGAFDQRAAALTASCLRSYAGAVVFYGLALLLGRAAMAAQWMRIPVAAGLLGLLVNTVLDWTLGRAFGAPGIGLAFTIASAVMATVASAWVRQRLGQVIPVGVVTRIAIASAVATASAAFLPISPASTLLELILRGTAFLVPLLVLYRILGVLGACASSWPARTPEGEVTS